jgi:PERQ amino acid-rich with GYF domain-containing protein
MEEEERKRQEEQQRFEAEELEKRKQMEEQYLLQKKQEELIKEQQAADLARQKEFLMQQQRLHQQEMERQQQRFEQQRLEQQQRIEQQRAEQQRLEQQRAEQARIEQLRQEQEREEQRKVQQELDEQRRLQQEHDERQRQHQLRVQEEQEAAAKQQELQKFAWMSAHNQHVQPSEPAPPALSLLEIQQEEAIKEQENALRQQAAKKNKQLQQEQARLQKEAKSGLSLKWAQPAQPQKVAIKSFTEIQAEEQAKLAKQQEKDREQRAIVNQHSQLQQAWSSSLTWANRASLNAPPTTTPKLNGGIWDDPPALGSGVKQAKTAAAAVRNSSPSNASTGASNASNKHTAVVQTGQAKRAKESDETFMKLFQEHGMNMKHSSRTQSQQDEFTRWCSETVEGIGGGNIDIATFVSFLKEVESPFEVNDYIRSYLGDGRDAREFGKEFLERRSRWKNAKNQDKDGGGFEDNLCRPAYAVNPTQSEFQEVKGKKGKKGKMQKVDSRILGFNTTSAPDRLNVGKRDYGDGTD